MIVKTKIIKATLDGVSVAVRWGGLFTGGPITSAQLSEAIHLDIVDLREIIYSDPCGEHTVTREVISDLFGLVSIIKHADTLSGGGYHGGQVPGRIAYLHPSRHL